MKKQVLDAIKKLMKRKQYPYYAALGFLSVHGNKKIRAYIAKNQASLIK